MEPISIAINFVSASSNTASQTGDSSLWWIFIICTFLLLGVLGVLLCKKNSFVTRFLYGRNASSTKTARHISGDCEKSSLRYGNKAKFIVIFLAVIFSISLIGLVSAKNAFGEGNTQMLTPDTDKITATVQDDGTISFSPCNLINTSEKSLTLRSAAIEVAQDAKSIEAINNCELTLNSFSTCIYKGQPNGEEQAVIDASRLDKGEATPLDLGIQNLDKQSAINLCGKQVFTLKFMPEIITTYELKTTGHGSWKEKGQLKTSIEVLGAITPQAGENISYEAPDQSIHTVSAIPDTEYDFSDCKYDTDNNAFVATFSLKMYGITATVADGQSDCGKVALNPTTISVPYGTAISYSADKKTITIGDASSQVYGTITATANPATAQYTYAFANWTSEPTTVTGPINFEANFSANINNYTITASVADGQETRGQVVLNPTSISNIPYGTPITYSADKTVVTIGQGSLIYGTITATPSEPSTYNYEFECWAMLPQADVVSGDINFVASFTKNLAWLPMQKATGDADNPLVNFYPAFKYPWDVDGYKFAVKDANNTFTEIAHTEEHPLSMSKICEYLTDTSISDSDTLYYQKTDSTKASLKCYAEKCIYTDLVFVYPGVRGVSGHVKEYTQEFNSKYVNYDIYTAQLGIVKEDGIIENIFGKYWNATNIGTPDDAPMINNVGYGGSVGFLHSYENILKNEGELYNTAWGTYYLDERDRLAFCSEDFKDESWIASIRGQLRAIVLATEFDSDVDPEPIDWRPMQIESGDGPIDFYPAFSQASEVDGYRFAVKDSEDKFREIENTAENPISMSRIYSALQPATESQRTTTLYYYKENSSAASLKCYTVKDMLAGNVFVLNQGTSGLANGYTENFKEKYLAHGITTAELDAKFGSNWNINLSESDTIPLVNDISYYKNGAGVQFYGDYGGSNGGLLSNNSKVACGSYVDTISAGEYFMYYFDVSSAKWNKDWTSGTPYGVVLAAEFGANKPEPEYWLPLQADTANGPIDFYPAFNSSSEVDGYRFAVKNLDGTYTEINGTAKYPISMSLIYVALQPEDKTKRTTTIYYYKEKDTAPPLKCYTTKDISYKDAFIIPESGPFPAKATDYTEYFKNTYQKDSSGNNNGVSTAQLDSYFGSGWDNTEGKPTVNTVPYSANFGTGSFYGSYGGWYDEESDTGGGLLSPSANYALGSFVDEDIDPYYFYVSNEEWDWTSTDDSWCAIILSKEFGGEEPPVPSHGGKITNTANNTLQETNLGKIVLDGYDSNLDELASETNSSQENSLETSEPASAESQNDSVSAEDILSYESINPNLASTIPRKPFSTNLNNFPGVSARFTLGIFSISPGL